MPNKTKSVKIGTWLFRWRSYLPLALIIISIPAILNFSYPSGSYAYELVWEMFCFAVSLAGLLIRAYTIGHTPKHTSGRNTKDQVASVLNTTGIYSVTRNPLYLGNFFMVMGVVMFARCWWLYLVYVLVFWIYYRLIILTEEDFLSTKFGQEYDDYWQRTPAFFPGIKQWKTPSLSFSLRNVLKREYPGFFAVIASFTVLDFLCESILAGKFKISVVWVILFFFGLATYLTLRFLRKKTRLLHVEGR